MNYQLNLPLQNLAKDRGRVNVLKNIMSAASAGIQKKASVLRAIIEFTVSEFPEILTSHTPFDILSADPSNPVKISPYPFEILDLIKQRNNQYIFPTVAELFEALDIDELSASLKDNTELIGIDESQVDIPLPQSNLSFLKSVAFRSYQLPNNQTDEAIGPIISDMRVQLGEDDSFENENRLLGYIRNYFVGYISALTALPYGRKPFIVLHGPLVRAIGGFSHLSFDYETAKNLLNINLDHAGEVNTPQDFKNSVINGDHFTQKNLSLIPQKAINGEENIRQFNKYCIDVCGRKCESGEVFSKEARPRQTSSKNDIQKRYYPGFCLYFWVLRSLFDLARLGEFTITSVVENVSSATEMNRLILPSLLINSTVRQKIKKSSLQDALKEARINLNSNNRTDIYRQSKQIIEKLRFLDAHIFSYILDEGQYTAPVQIYRYRSRNTFINAIGDSSLGTKNDYEPILNTLFPPEPQTQKNTYHPGYRVLMSYVRTTPLREPVRVEYFNQTHLQHQQVIGAIYLLSLPYQQYGLPIILYCADKLARTPTKLVRTIVEQEYLELILKQSISSSRDPAVYQRLLGHLTRNYFQREGM